MTVCSHLPPAHRWHAPYPGSVSRDPKELLIAACLLNLGYFDRSVAEDVRNEQAGAITPSQLLPTPGLMLPRSPCLQPCFATTPRYSHPAACPVTQGLISHRQTWISYTGKKSSSPRPSCLHSQRGPGLGGKGGWLSPVAVPSMGRREGAADTCRRTGAEQNKCCSFSYTWVKNREGSTPRSSETRDCSLKSRTGLLHPPTPSHRAQPTASIMGLCRSMGHLPDKEPTR